MVFRAWLVALLAAASVGLQGCAKAVAKAEPERPPLVVPEPPPRAFAPVEPEEIVGEPVVEAPASPAAPRPARKPPAKPTAAKPDTGKEDPAKTDTAGNRPEDALDRIPGTEATPPLRTPQTANEAEVQRKIAEYLTRARDTLNSINYRALNADAKSQYDTAKRFIQQAENAVTSQNWVFATSLAEKADTLSRGLLRR
jgi:hypothetical protein